MSHGIVLKRLPKLADDAPSALFKRVNVGSIANIHPYYIGGTPRIDPTHPGSKANPKIFPKWSDEYSSWKALPVNVLAIPENMKTFARTFETWEQRVARGRAVGTLPPQLVNNEEPHRVPVSISIVRTKNNIHKKAVWRNAIRGRIKSAIGLMVRRGAIVDDDKRLILRTDTTIEDGYRLFRPGWHYVCVPTLDVYRLSIPELICRLRQCLTTLGPNIEAFEAKWAKAENLEPPTSVIPPLDGTGPEERVWPAYKTVLEHKALMTLARKGFDVGMLDAVEPRAEDSVPSDDSVGEIKTTQDQEECLDVQGESMHQPKNHEEANASRPNNSRRAPSSTSKREVSKFRPDGARSFSSMSVRFASPVNNGRVGMPHSMRPSLPSKKDDEDMQGDDDLLSDIVSRLEPKSKVGRRRFPTIPADHDWFKTLLKEYNVAVGPPANEQSTRGSEVDSEWMDALSKKEDPKDVGIEAVRPRESSEPGEAKPGVVDDSPLKALDRSKDRLGRATMVKLPTKIPNRGGKRR